MTTKINNNVAEKNIMLSDMVSALSIAELLAKRAKANVEKGGSINKVDAFKNEEQNAQKLLKALGGAVNMAKREVAAAIYDAKKDDKKPDRITVISDRNLTLDGKKLPYKSTMTIDNTKNAQQAIKLKLIKLIK